MVGKWYILNCAGLQTSNSIVAEADSLAGQHARLFQTSPDMLDKGRAASLVLDSSAIIAKE